MKTYSRLWSAITALAVAALAVGVPMKESQLRDFVPGLTMCQQIIVWQNACPVSNDAGADFAAIAPDQEQGPDL